MGPLDMGGRHEVTRSLKQQEPGQGRRYANAADTPKLAQNKTQSHKRGRHYIITPKLGDSFTIQLMGREAWALDRLIAAGLSGCTPADNPAPRWSGYVHKLREHRVPIETLHEHHDGEFSGTHGRYVLRAKVQKGGVV